MTEKKYKCKAGSLRFASGCDIETPSPRNQRCSACAYLERDYLERSRGIDAPLDTIFESYDMFEKGLAKHIMDVYDSFSEHEKKVVRENVLEVWENPALNNNEMIEGVSSLLMGMRRRMLFVYKDRIEVNSKDSIKGT